MQEATSTNITNRYFIQEHLHNTVFHGGIGNIDIERILVREGFRPIVFPFHYDFSIKAKVFRHLFLLKVFSSIPAGSVVFFQFPLYARVHQLLIRLLAKRHSVKVICLVADINGLKDADRKVLKKEIDFLRRLRYFVVHGKPMEDWLSRQVNSVKISRLHFFDFLTKPSHKHREKSFDIAFAGNLDKSRFLEKLHLVNGTNNLHFNLYGPDASKAMMEQPGVAFKGVYEPYSLPDVLEGAFGLLWDGDSIEGAGGNYGDYMAYISHHKLSLYILAGLPIIVYAHAGSAYLINELHIGFAVESLYEMEEKIRLLPDDAYEQMRTNMKPLARNIASGLNLKEAIAGVVDG